MINDIRFEGPTMSTAQQKTSGVKVALKGAPDAVNTVVFENREVRTYFKDDRTIAQVPLRRPPKVTGRIRVVEVADFDYSACGGTHCLRTGEVGIIKITRWEKIRENLRFDFLCGWRALCDYGMKHRQIRELSNEMTVGEAEVAAAFVRMQADLKSLRREHRKAREQLVEQEAQKEIAAALAQEETDFLKPVHERLEGRYSYAELKYTAAHMRRTENS